LTIAQVMLSAVENLGYRPDQSSSIGINATKRQEQEEQNETHDYPPRGNYFYGHLRSGRPNSPH
jgi:hypothetical protein